MPDLTRAIAPATLACALAACLIAADQPRTGDVNLDGDVDYRDAEMICRYLADTTAVPLPLDLADVSGDGAVSMYDASLILVGARHASPGDWAEAGR
jgi:hypothetical protein